MMIIIMITLTILFVITIIIYDNDDGDEDDNNNDNNDGGDCDHDNKNDDDKEKSRLVVMMMMMMTMTPKPTNALFHYSLRFKGGSGSRGNPGIQGRPGPPGPPGIPGQGYTAVSFVHFSINIAVPRGSLPHDHLPTISYSRTKMFCLRRKSHALQSDWSVKMAPAYDFSESMLCTQVDKSILTVLSSCKSGFLYRIKLDVSLIKLLQVLKKHKIFL